MLTIINRLFIIEPPCPRSSLPPYRRHHRSARVSVVSQIGLYEINYTSALSRRETDTRRRLAFAYLFPGRFEVPNGSEKLSGFYEDGDRALFTTVDRPQEVSSGATSIVRKPDTDRTRGDRKRRIVFVFRENHELLRKSQRIAKRPGF